MLCLALALLAVLAGLYFWAICRVGARADEWHEQQRDCPDQ